MLETEIFVKRKEKKILIMAHIVLGYPNFAASEQIVEQMYLAGVDIIELQIPFSEPMADGPIILHANQIALENGSTINKCFEIAQKLVQKYPIPFLFMTYYNPIFVRGIDWFTSNMSDVGIRGAIIPDLPPEEGEEFIQLMNRKNLDPILLLAPNSSPARIKKISEQARGFVYCVARKGVTGANTQFGNLDEYLSRCRNSTNLPLALGFGIKNKEDVKSLIGKIDIAVIGSETIRVMDQSGIEEVGKYMASLQAANQ